MTKARTIDERIARIDWQRDTIKGARLAVDRWFVEIDQQPAFLPGDGAAIKFSREEFIAVRHGAYVKVAELVMSADAWAGRLVIGIVLLAVIGGSVGQWPPSEARAWILALVVVAGVVHGGFGLYGFVRRYAEVQTVRASVAFALRGRVPGRLPPTDRRVQVNPFPTLIALTTFLFLAWLFASDALHAVGLEAYSGAADFVLLAMTAATGLFGAANWWIEARRKARSGD